MNRTEPASPKKLGIRQLERAMSLGLLSSGLRGAVFSLYRPET